MSAAENPQNLPVLAELGEHFGKKLVIEIDAEGFARTTRFCISPENVIAVTDTRKRSILDFFLTLAPTFAAHCRIGIEEVALHSTFDNNTFEHVLYLTSTKPVPRPAAVPKLKDPDAIEI
jgi:hypothetical protein